MRSGGSTFIVLGALALLLSSRATLAVDIHVETTLVVVPVSVTDSQNRFVLGLTKRDFTLLEDGAQQTIQQFAGENAPISICLLVDVSGSMGSKIGLLDTAVAAFLKTLTSDDEASLIAFGDGAQIVADFTADTGTLTEKLRQVEPQGLTALLDAVSLGLDEMKKAKNPRKALLIISDGGDNHSRYSTAQIKELTRKADVQVYSMGVFNRFPAFLLSPEEISGPKLLRDLSAQTGGRSFSASDPEQLPAIAERIGIELRNQYVLAYSPSNRKRDGSYRRLKVDVKAPPGLPPLTARGRLGYYAPLR